MERRKKALNDPAPAAVSLPSPAAPDAETGSLFLRAVYEVARNQCNCAACKFVKHIVERQLEREG